MDHRPGRQRHTLPGRQLLPGRLSGWSRWRLLGLAVLALGGLGALGTATWAAVSVRRRPVGHDVVAAMSVRQACPPSVVSGDPDTPPPVVLVHGLGMSSRSMGPLVQALGRTTWTLAPDLPGYGRSPQPRLGMLGVDELAGTLLRWMDDQGIRDAVLVGHSVGAQVVGEVSVRAPARVRRLVMVAPTGDPDRPSVLRQSLHLLRGAVDEPPKLIAVAALDYLIAGPGQMAALARRIILRKPLQLDVTMDVPLLVVRGSRDRVCSQDWCERLVASTARSRLEVVDGSAHGIVYEAPDELVALIRDEVLAPPT